MDEPNTDESNEFMDGINWRKLNKPLETILNERMAELIGQKIAKDAQNIKAALEASGEGYDQVNCSKKGLYTPSDLEACKTCPGYTLYCQMNFFDNY